MASQKTPHDVEHGAEELVQEPARLRAANGGRIPPEEYDRYRARAAALRAEAISHLLSAAHDAAAAEVRRLFHWPRGDEEDAPSRG